MKKIFYTFLLYFYFLNNSLISDEHKIDLGDLCDKHPYACRDYNFSKNDASGGMVGTDKEKPIKKKSKSDRVYEDRKIIRNNN